MLQLFLAKFNLKGSYQEGCRDVKSHSKLFSGQMSKLKMFFNSSEKVAVRYS